jgi:AraC-like DNA-binding protein
VRVNRLIKQHGNEVLLAGSDNRLSPVLTYIHGACTTPVSVDELAERFSYSPSHLAHSFKNQMGISLYHYVLLRRLQMGREAMLQGVPVKEAYQKCGFGDYAGFYRAFVKEYGLSPQQYKKRNQ